ncbi:MAG TPA: dTDP-4-dehydrorhamnose 3,5-epimerase family protein [Candidatus Omnitrophota bacterium]|nr:dTDP-4-dehydrorhamnose 3,5-epimerase family protein [Candidatus Omnitrophota bacterium]
MDEVKLIKGGLAVDDRGQIQFCNDFDMKDIRRFYIVSNHRAGFIRAWHAHKKEAKYASVTCGSAILAAVKIDDWKSPSKDAKVERFVLSEKTPAVLMIPAGYANGFKTLTKDTKVIFYSTSTLQESLGDDYRYDAKYWDPWKIEER